MTNDDPPILKMLPPPHPTMSVYEERLRENLAEAINTLESVGDAMTSVSLKLAEHYPDNPLTDDLRTTLAVAHRKIEQFLRPEG